MVLDVLVIPRKPTATFIVRGSRPSVVEVHGIFDSTAAVGFHALAASLIGESDVVIDLRPCESVDSTAHRAVADFAARMDRAGGKATVCQSLVAAVA